ncbi:MAG: ribosomal subunit interface protein [Candidatus Magasanikbacteria bacterium CG10_big_fil_rev_8_21_14_0_10_47_10]|uniref:Ribosomal subunit interface protein n=1 Tax=Candidatus Magasanikbacteria bacterium CG10_big_fil_rev_8_21_14_0_10_47_10 TaxID=1974652 RepID=A0A2H0TRT2_9BACT|nr:MAG: ribosomal subunit interface protein [Candidatus Magasanikbacteria bacterium CG10_big_fil_rev_8_21_14_0_10_47_10]
MTINTKAIGMDMTDAINRYAREKAESVEKFFDNIQQIDVTFGSLSNHHNKGKIFFAEMNVHVPGKNVFVKKEADDLYKAIDKVKDHLKVEFEKMKGKMRDKDKQSLRDQKGYQM